MMRGLVRVVLVAVVSCVAVAETRAQKTEKDGITFSVDRFEGISRVVSKSERLDGGSFGSVGNVFLQFQRFTAKDSTVSFQVFAVYRGSEWLFISEGESLVMLVDGERLGLTSTSGSRSSREVIGARNLYERAMYETDVATLTKLAKAKVVELKLSGSRGYLERTFSKDVWNRLRAFLVLGAGVPEAEVAPR